VVDRDTVLAYDVGSPVWEVRRDAVACVHRNGRFVVFVDAEGKTLMVIRDHWTTGQLEQLCAILGVPLTSRRR